MIIAKAVQGVQGVGGGVPVWRAAPRLVDLHIVSVAVCCPHDRVMRACLYRSCAASSEQFPWSIVREIHLRAGMIMSLMRGGAPTVSPGANACMCPASAA